MRRLAAVGLVAVLAGGCGTDTAGGTTVTITVFAAASLTDAFAELGQAFSAEHPRVRVRFNVGPSSGLATQVLEGAPGDVLASADPSATSRVVAAGAALDTPEVFARNSMEIAVPAGNPGRVVGLADFARSDLLVGACAEEVPCGRLARRLLAGAAVAPVIDTEEADVRSLLTRIEAGELDAGLVYRSDVLAAAGSVEGIDVPGADQVLATYEIVALAGSATPEVARAFVALVGSGVGQRILADHGFLPR